jgi:hypothetical protein
LASKAKVGFSLLVLRGMLIVIGCLGVTWTVPDLAANAISDEFSDLDARLLRFEAVRPSSATRLLQNAEDQALSPCDTRVQNALLLLEMPLAEVALRSGTTQDFDRHLNAIESRSRQMLSCAPRDSFAWLLLFGIEIEHGNLSTDAFDLLKMSYDTSPNEGWLGVRRMAVAIPVVQAAPEPLQQTILAEFERLIRNRLVEIPARAYSSASKPVRALLDPRIDRLDANTRKLFSDTLAGLRRP